jgi:hypothetical protein
MEFLCQPADDNEIQIICFPKTRALAKLNSFNPIFCKARSLQGLVFYTQKPQKKLD